ncbi:DUF6177 family protein [Actinomyces ruminicola]|uniref:Uncharacterized protein n=1 Tax=Actinomyces ruminicola TaxID=332524 RepID=A0A1G9Z7G9_9ACTO|nr:DUF6177 family protein [Actinomyces ruminicola]SDN17274.1 hypothetical protein SAMN04487766_11635 [Actinomyces ruminicola]
MPRGTFTRPGAPRAERLTFKMTHPMLDAQIGNRARITRLPGPVVALTEPLADLLHRTAGGSQRTILVVPEHSAVTPAFDRLTDATGTIVLVQEDATYRELRSGRLIPQLSQTLEVLDQPQLKVSPRHMVQRDVRPNLTVSISVYHPARRTTRLGGVVELVAEHLLPDAELSWGGYEPAGAFWERDALTDFCRAHMPTIHLVLAGHSDHGTLTGTITVSRTDNGLEEYVELSLAGATPATAYRDRAMALFRTLSTEAKPQFALAMRTYARADTSLPVTMRRPPTPLAVLIGAPGMRQLGVDAAQVASAHGGEATGYGRRRGLLVPLESNFDADWQPLLDLVRTLDGDAGNVSRALGVEAGTSTARGAAAPRP